MLEAMRQDLARLHQELPKNGLVAWTSGNISARDPASGLVVIKASGVRYEDLGPEHMVIVDLEGRVLESDLKPSSDTLSHLRIYRDRQDVAGIVHTHSAYATAFAANAMAIPVYLTAHADLFGGPIPCAGFAPIGGEEIGQAVLEAIGESCAVLLKNHGVFTIGPTAGDAVKAAVMVEEVARTSWLALQLGHPQEIPPATVAALRRRYRDEYGQK